MTFATSFFGIVAKLGLLKCVVEASLFLLSKALDPKFETRACPLASESRDRIKLA
jgi:hypothetical protein